MSKIKIIVKPHHFIEDVLCPYCNQPTLGVMETKLDDNQSRYRFACLNENCITTFICHVGWELDCMAREILAKNDRK